MKTLKKEKLWELRIPSEEVLRMFSKDSLDYTNFTRK